MEILGYSERGMIYSLLLDLDKMDKSSLQAVIQALIKEIKFVNTSTTTPLVGGEITILIEPSFSDFGDSDLVIICGSTTFFIEAKVATYSKKFSLEEEFKAFEDPATRSASMKEDEAKRKSSNLFTQLYHKMGLVDGLKNGLLSKKLDCVEFDLKSTVSKRKIGTNPVVLDLAKKIMKGNVFYIGLVPNTEDEISNFNGAISADKTKPENLSEFWSWDNVGFLNYKLISEILPEDGVFRKTLDFNRLQVYGKNSETKE